MQQPVSSCQLLQNRMQSSRSATLAPLHTRLVLG